MKILTTEMLDNSFLLLLVPTCVLTPQCLVIIFPLTVSSLLDLSPYLLLLMLFIPPFAIISPQPKGFILTFPVVQASKDKFLVSKSDSFQLHFET